MRYGFAIKIGSLTAAAVDMSLAYFIIDLLMGQTLTWPMILLGVWVTDTIMTPLVKKAILERI